MENMKNIYFIFVVISLLGLFFIISRTDLILSSSNKNIFNKYDDKSNNIVKKQIPNEFLKSSEKYLIIRTKYDKLHEDNVISFQTANNIKQTLDYMKKTTVIVEAKTFDYDFSKYSTVVISLRNLSSLKKIDKLIEYIENGGNLLLAIAPEFDDNYYNIYRKLGIIESQDFYQSSSMILTDNLFLRAKGLVLKQPNTVLGISLDPKCKVYAVSSETNTPMIWSFQNKKGKIVVFNGTSLDSKNIRGCITGMLSLFNETFMYPIMNLKVVFMDDFPSSSMIGENSDIRKKYGRNISEFYRDIWWPDILRTTIKNNIKYTSVLIENYNNKVLPPYNEDATIAKESLITYGREILKSGGEIGIHGYNHQPLAKKGYIKDTDLGYLPWESEEHMAEAMNSILNFAKKVYPNYTFSSYVPPSNILSAHGRKALKVGIPSIRTISSLYIDGGIEKDELIQEFLIASDGIVDFPRISSGYNNSPTTKWSIYSAISSIGVFSHFIHPDDVLDKERNNNKSWEVMFGEYQELLNSLDTDFDWLRPLKTIEASNLLKGYYNTNVYLKYYTNRINGFIDNNSFEVFFILRTQKTITESKNCISKKIDTDFYLISTKENNFSLVLSDLPEVVK